MPTVTFFTKGKTAQCPEGANLREVAMQCGVSVYNGPAKLLNCRGRGLCGTCRVSIEPLKGVSAPTEKELRHPIWGRPQVWANARLSCQTRVYGDIQVATMV